MLKLGLGCVCIYIPCVYFMGAEAKVWVPSPIIGNVERGRYKCYVPIDVCVYVCVYLVRGIIMCNKQQPISYLIIITGLYRKGQGYGMMFREASATYNLKG